MGSIDKRFLRPNNGEHKKGDGVHRQGVEGVLGGRTMVPGGELASSDDPESLLIRHEEEDTAEAADRGMTLKQYRESQKKQKFDKAA